MFTQRVAVGSAAAREYWRVYSPDKYGTQSATLILSGDMDPQTPHYWAAYAATHYRQPNQYYMTNPYGLHGTVLPFEVISIRFEVRSPNFNLNGIFAEQLRCRGYGRVSDGSKPRTIFSLFR